MQPMTIDTMPTDFDTLIEEGRQSEIKQQGLEHLEAAFRRDQSEAISRARLMTQILIRNANHLLRALDQIDPKAPRVNDPIGIEMTL